MARRVKSNPYAREAILSPYWTPRRGPRHAGFWLMPGLIFFCFIWGFFYAFTAPYLIAFCAVPVVALAAVIVWALPEARRAPVKAIWPLLFAFVIGMVAWPNYLALDLPGLPWVTVIRLIGFPMFLVTLVAFSTSKEFREQLFEQLGAAPILVLLVLGYGASFGLTWPIAGHAAPASLQRVIICELEWILMFFIALWAFRVPGRVEKVAATICILAFGICVFGIIEAHYKKPLMGIPIPSFLRVDPNERYLESIFRLGTNQYRTKATFSTPIGMGEYLALCFPFLLQFMTGRYNWWVKIGAFLTIPLLFYAVRLTDSRVGLIGSVLGTGGFILVKAVERWRTDKGSVLGPAIALIYPALALAGVGLIFVSKHVHDALLGNPGDTRASTQGRIMQWKMGIPHILHNPIGYGMGQAGATLHYVNPNGTGTVDSYYLTTLLESGVLGLIMFIGTFIAGISYCGLYVWKNSAFGSPTQKVHDRELEFLVPLGCVFGSFLVIKMVFSQPDLHPILFIELGMVVALAWRSRAILRGESVPVFQPKQARRRPGQRAPDRLQPQPQPQPAAARTS